MKIGVKCYHEEDFLDYCIKKADFFEVQGLRGKEYDFLKKYTLPIVIHAEHNSQGSNPADITNKKINIESLQQAIKIADSCNSKKIIFHPGFIAHESCSEENALKFIKNIKDERILLENMPHEQPPLLMMTPLQTKKFMEKTGKGFIFDLAHCIIASHYLKKDTIEFIKEFLKLKPKHFHISGQKWDSMKDLHLPLTECDFDLKNILKLYPKTAEITLEVSKYDLCLQLFLSEHQQL